MRQAGHFHEVETFCLFIGYPRSGHTLIGSLLDAHPQAVIAHELDLLRFVYARFFKRQLFAMLLENSSAAASLGAAWNGYSYQVPGQWQGRFQRIKVIGDKHGEATTVRLHLSPWLLDRLTNMLGIPIKFIHVIRNPFDNIATIARKTYTINPMLLKSRNGELQDSIDYYFTLCDTAVWIQQQRSQDVLLEHHESFVASPQSELERICFFLGLPTTAEYLESCAAIVFKGPNRSRFSVTWTPELIQQVQTKMQLYPFLKNYTFQD